MSNPAVESGSGSLLDPGDWGQFRVTAHEALDLAIDHLAGARERLVWQAMPADAKAAIAGPAPRANSPLESVLKDFRQFVFPYPTGNTHPRFFGWVHGTGTTAGLVAEILAAAMNSNCGGREHSAIYVERAVLDWCKEIFGFPASAGGVLTAGTSSATLVALCAARTWKLGTRSRKEGIASSEKLTAYASVEAHSAIAKAFEIMGIGSQALRAIPVNGDKALDVRCLRDSIAEDRAAGQCPLCVIATAGSVNTGAFDDIGAIAEICESENLWLHVDGAFGVWTRIAGPALSRLTRGIERAHSLAFDFHKWMFVQYDCGGVLVRDAAWQRAAFAAHPDYLEPQIDGVGGGAPWFCDYGIDLSRGFRALKVWFTIREYGLDRLGAKIAENCAQARRMGELLERVDELELCAPVTSNICCFRYARAGLSPELLDELNAKLAIRLQMDGVVVFSTTRVDGKVVLRACIVNHRTVMADVELAVVAARRIGAELAASAIEQGSG